MAKPLYPIANYVSYSNLTPQYQTFLVGVNQSQEEPKSFVEASIMEEWRRAMDSEL